MKICIPSFKIWEQLVTHKHKFLKIQKKKNWWNGRWAWPGILVFPLLFFLRIAEGCCCCCCFVSFCLSRKSRTAQRDRNGKKLLDRADVWGERERGGGPIGVAPCTSIYTLRSIAMLRRHHRSILFRWPLLFFCISRFSISTGGCRQLVRPWCHFLCHQLFSLMMKKERKEKKKWKRCKCSD